MDFTDLRDMYRQTQVREGAKAEGKKNNGFLHGCFESLREARYQRPYRMEAVSGSD